MKLKPLVPYVIAVGLGAVYGLMWRALLVREDPGVAPNVRQAGVLLFGVMSISFLFVVPLVVGFLVVRLVPRPTILHALFGGWPACVLSIAVTALVGWEGSICILMASPVMLPCSTVGGLIAWWIKSAQSKAVTYTALALPLAVWQIERIFDVPTNLRTVRSEIAIDASPAEVWSQIVSVPTIRPDEIRPSLATRLGFPRPVEATLDRPGVGGVRRATFEGGVLFLETIDAWEPERKLSFSIAAQTETIPPETLDEHVTIGGPYFDVLEGTYTIESRGAGVVLHLESRVRVSTMFNLYAGPWADALMGSIQEQILDVLKRRCETGRLEPR